MSNIMNYSRISTYIEILLVIICLSSCDFTIENPGPIRNDLLNNPATLPSLINGMKKAFANGQNEVAYISAAVSKEVTAAGSVSLFGISQGERKGDLAPGEEHVDGIWNDLQQARWVAENGVKRMKKILGDKFSLNKYAIKGLIWGAYSLRLLGENECVAIIDGGAPQKNIVYFEKAEEKFTKAINLLKDLNIPVNANGTNLLIAAYAGRASVRIFLNDWVGAIADAKKVPINFVFASQRSDIKISEYNQFFWGNANQPYRAFSVYNTYYENYYKNYQDPRASWSSDPDFPVGDGGVVPWLFPTKYTSKSSPINLSSGREMLLIRAEAVLRNGKWKNALSMINSLRTSIGVQAWAANNEVETWTRLKRERGIELWLEGRRLGDLRRWTINNTPGKMEDMSGRDLCFSISLDELETNPDLRNFSHENQDEFQFGFSDKL